MVRTIHYVSTTDPESEKVDKYSQVGNVGVYITNSLNWTKQVVEVKKKVNKILGILQRT